MRATNHLYQAIATAVAARQTCLEKDNTEWVERWEGKLSEYEAKLPKGGGFDSGTKIALERSTPDQLVFDTSFHHMDDSGYYDRWTDHTVTVIPSLQFGFNLRISGRNYREIKDYIYESFEILLSQEVDGDAVVDEIDKGEK